MNGDALGDPLILLLITLGFWLSVGTVIGLLLARFFPRVWVLRATFAEAMSRTGSKTGLQGLAACFYWFGALGLFLSGTTAIAAVFTLAALVAGLAFYIIFLQRLGLGVGAGLMYLPWLRPWVGIPYWLWLLLGPPTGRTAKVADWLAFLGAVSGFTVVILAMVQSGIL
jgi:hypothetical protein